MKTIGSKIKQVRNYFGHTQKNFGTLVGVSDAHISKIEAGKDYPSQTLIQVICTKFGVDEKWLTGEDNRDFTMRNDNALKNRFVELLEEHGMDETDVLKKIAIPSHDYWLLCRGNPNISIDTLVKVCNFFNVSLDWLIKGEEHSICHSVDLSIEEIILLKEYNKLDDDEKFMFKSLLDKIAKSK